MAIRVSSWVGWRASPLCAALLSAAATARAEPATVTWKAPAICPDQAEVREDVERLLGRKLATASEKPFSARGVVSSAENRWQLRLELETAEGVRRRSVEGKSCREVTDAGAVIIALAIDPNARADAADAAAHPPPAVAPPQRPESRTPP